MNKEKMAEYADEIYSTMKEWIDLRNNKHRYTKESYEEVQENISKKIISIVENIRNNKV